MNFDNPDEFDDPTVFDDLNLFSNGSREFDNLKVYGDTSIWLSLILLINELKTDLFTLREKW